MEVQKRLTLEGYIVISVGLFGHSGDEEVWKPGTKEMLDDMHLRKIENEKTRFILYVFPAFVCMGAKAVFPANGYPL